MNKSARTEEKQQMERNRMKWATLLVAAILASGSLQAAGTIKPYTNKAAFAADDVVDWFGLTTLAGGDKCVNVATSFASLPSGLGKVIVSGKATNGSFRRCNEGISFFGNFTGGDRLLTTDVNKAGPIVLTFATPVYGAGLQIEAIDFVGATGQLKAFDANNNLLGTATVTSTHTNVLPADNTAPFVGIRSSVKEIARIEIDTPGVIGFAVNSLQVALGASPVLNSSFFVNQLYNDVLGRAPSAVELSSGLALLTANPAGLPDLAVGVLQSPEFENNASYLTKCYLALLGRDPDYTSWMQIFKLMQSGAQQVTTLNGFLAAPEYLAQYPGTMTNPVFVTSLYQNLLGRAPDAPGLAYWNFLLNFGIPRSLVLNGFLTSPEYSARVSHRVTANLLYLTLLQRTGEAAGVNFWKVVLDFGVPMNSVVGSFINSPEYLARF
jgi:uncharacterized protein DUF4214